MGRGQVPPPRRGLFGAPRCRLTGGLVALFGVLAGLVFAGVGGTIAGFMWQESFARIMGILCVAVGLVLMSVGVGMLLVDSKRNRNRQLLTEDYAYEEASQSAPATATTTPGKLTPMNSESSIAAVKADRKTKSIQEDAPPPYECFDTGAKFSGASRKTPTASATGTELPGIYNVKTCQQFTAPTSRGTPRKY